MARLEAALKARGFEVKSAAPADYTIRAAIEALAGGPESLSIRRTKNVLTLRGADARGLMYAAVETAERIAAATGPDPFAQIADIDEKPFLKGRGVSMYTMQRAYFESRLHDERHWQSYFDMLAASRINNFVVIFGYENGGYMAPLYPYFFNVPEYPGVEAVGVTADQQARNSASFKALIRIAHERGIEVTVGIWDHIYRGGVQGGGIPGASENAGKRTPGLVWGVTADNLAAYTKAALQRFVDVFPEIDAIQFRMHDESGLKPSEMDAFWHEVFGLIHKARPNIRVDLRAKGLPDNVIADALSQGLNARVNTKYWMEQMGLPFHPTHINRENQMERRHGFADMLRYPQTYRMHWQLWNGGTTRLLLWGDPEYVRRFAESVRIYDGDSFELNEMLATRMLGEAHDTPVREILAPGLRYFDYEFERYWHFYRVWGRASYNPQTPPEVYRREFDRRFGSESGGALMRALQLASQVLPRIVAASYRYENFPTTRGWAEMNHQGSLPQYANAEGSDTQQFLNTRDEARRLLAGSAPTAMRRPAETSRWFSRTADAILAQVAAAKGSGNEFRSTITDLRILAGLAAYHSRRLDAGVKYNLYREGGALQAFDGAIEDERQAIAKWRGIVEAAGDVYSQELAFGPHAVGFRRHWKEELGLMENEFEQLLAERRAAAPKPGARVVSAAELEVKLNPPAVQLLPAPVAVTGHDVEITARVTPTGMHSMKLRYRHMTQFEDYQSADMTLDARSGLYRGRIPAAFVAPQWDLMYFVEAIDKRGAGRMYPDLDVEMPYVVLPVKRVR